jgi:hypothetical protein
MKEEWILLTLMNQATSWQKKQILKNKTDGKERSIKKCTTDSDLYSNVQITFFSFEWTGRS